MNLVYNEIDHVILSNICAAFVEHGVQMTMRTFLQVQCLFLTWMSCSSRLCLVWFGGRVQPVYILECYVSSLARSKAVVLKLFLIAYRLWSPN